MTKNPILNALAALIYIVLVACVMFYGSHSNSANTIIIPIAVVSLFTLSAAVMGYIFLYEPAQLYFANKRKAAVDLFLQTVAIFAIITIIIFFLLITGIFK